MRASRFGRSRPSASRPGRSADPSRASRRGPSRSSAFPDSGGRRSSTPSPPASPPRRTVMLPFPSWEYVVFSSCSLSPAKRTACAGRMGVAAGLVCRRFGRVRRRDRRPGGASARSGSRTRSATCRPRFGSRTWSRKPSCAGGASAPARRRGPGRGGSGRRRRQRMENGRRRRRGLREPRLQGQIVIRLRRADPTAALVVELERVVH